MSESRATLVERQREAAAAIDDYLANLPGTDLPGTDHPGPAAAGAAWPAGDALVLDDDTAVELGNPAIGSLGGVVYTDAPVPPGVRLVGPDLDALGGRRDVAFGRILRVQLAGDGPASSEAEYRRHLAVQDALAERQGALEGLLVRTRPSQQRIWCRVNRAAVSTGRSLIGYGAALVEAATALEPVIAAQALLVVDRPDDLARLAPAVELAARAAAALVKRHEEPDRECGRCDYSDVCDQGDAG